MISPHQQPQAVIEARNARRDEARLEEVCIGVATGMPPPPSAQERRRLLKTIRLSLATAHECMELIKPMDKREMAKVGGALSKVALSLMAIDDQEET